MLQEGGCKERPEECPASYFLKLGQCYSCAAGCLSCQGRSSCSRCFSSWRLYQGECVDDCPSGYFSSAAECQACQPPCRTCRSLGACLTCESGKILLSGTCTPCPGGVCSPCSAAWFSTATGCQPCPDHCNRCLSRASCFLCKEGYSLKSELC